MAETDTKLDQLRQKYAAVMATVEQQRISITNLRLQDGKLYIQGAAHNQDAKERVFSQLQAVDPRWHHEVELDLRTEEDQPPRLETGHSTVNTSQDFSIQDTQTPSRDREGAET